MKKLKFFVSVILLLPLIVGCSTKIKDETLLAKDYFPIFANTLYEYEGKGIEYASYKEFIDYTTSDRIQRRINNGGTESAEVVQVANGKVTVIWRQSEIYYRQNELDRKGTVEILLMEPIKVGTHWTNSDTSVSTITSIAKDVATPSGTYQAVEVTKSGSDPTTINLYAKDVGLVKTIYNPGPDEISSSLKKIDKNASLSQSINFYYPNITDGKTYYETRILNFQTNDITKIILETSYKKTIAEAGKVFNETTKINSLSLQDDGIVTIDLNQSFLDDMNAGSLYESMILQSIATTFGTYYLADKVVITIDGKLYKSGHIVFTEGQSLRVNKADAVQVNPTQ